MICGLLYTCAGCRNPRCRCGTRCPGCGRRCAGWGGKVRSCSCGSSGGCCFSLRVQYNAVDDDPCHHLARFVGQLDSFVHHSLFDAPEHVKERLASTRSFTRMWTWVTSVLQCYCKDCTLHTRVLHASSHQSPTNTDRTDQSSS